MAVKEESLIDQNLTSPDQSEKKNSSPLPKNPNSFTLFFILSLLVVFLLVSAFFYFKKMVYLSPEGPDLSSRVSPTVTPPFTPIPTESPLSVEVSSSTDLAVIEKELQDTDLGSFENDLQQLENQAKGL